MTTTFAASPSPAPQRARHCAALVLVLAACGRGDQAQAAGASPDALHPLDGRAALTVDGDVYSFRTSVCSATPADFAATGMGHAGRQPFVVTVRGPDLLVVKFGVRAEMEVPPPGARWLYGSADTALAADGHTISGSARLADVRSPDAATAPARVDINCG